MAEEVATTKGPKPEQVIISTMSRAPDCSAEVHEGCVWLAGMYCSGDSVEPDARKGISILEREVKAGRADAMYQLG